MADDGSTKNYKFGPKNNWRRTILNYVLRLTGGREKKEIVLYTPGPQDNEREILIDKGVPRLNVIGIDRTRENIETLRDRDNYGVHADWKRALFSWKQAPVCAVLIDVCCGLEPWIIEIATLAFENAALSSAVLMVNMQRGRDAKSNPIREALSKCGYLRDDLHRGKQLIRWMSSDIVNRMQKLRREDGLGYFSFDEEMRLIEYIETDMQAKYFSYQSGDLVFDSVVFTPGLAGRMSSRAPNGELAKDVAKQLGHRKTKQRLAAALAMRTMRQRRSFPIRRKR